MAATSPERRAQMREYRARNRERLRAADRARYEADREAYIARSKATYDALTPEEKRARAAKNRARPTHLDEKNADQSRIRREVIDGYGGQCACCGNDFLPHLTVDHIAGGGSAERRSPGGGQRSLYRRLRREGFPEGFQVLCWNCNWTKHLHGRCPCSDREG